MVPWQMTAVLWDFPVDVIKYFVHCQGAGII